MIPQTLIGHYTDKKKATGCTVILFEADATCGYFLMGGAPGTRETDLLDPSCLVQSVNAIVLAGGSAFGLAAADGVMRFLREKGVGYSVGPLKVPIVPAAIIFDLMIGDPHAYPDAEAGYKACLNAASSFERGSVGAGTGATVGKAFGTEKMMKSGLGFGAREAYGVEVHAIAVVNAFGNIVDEKGTTIAGAYDPNAGFLEVWCSAQPQERRKPNASADQASPLVNTTLVAIITDAKLSKAEARVAAKMAHDGIARSIVPSHTLYDGDLIFAASVGQKQLDISLVGHMAAGATQDAILDAVRSAEGLCGVPSAREVGSCR